MLYTLLTLLAGCPATDGAAPDDTAPSTGVTVNNFVQADCDGDSGSVTESLSAEPGASANTVAVEHNALGATCCVTLAAAATAADGTINVTYTEGGTPCDCMCRYDVTYTLGNVPSGDWIVDGGSVTDDVSVP